MAKCDLCDKTCKAVEMTQLLEIYQVDGVIDVCKDCEKWASNLKSEILAKTAPQIREAISIRKGTPPARNWFDHIKYRFS
jgi:ribosome-binding protein aMBF1 (putative translation factor)